MKKLDGKVAVIAGAGEGIGRATAYLFAQEGARVAILARRKEVGEATIKQIKANGGEAIFIATDLTQSQQIQNAFKQTAEHFGKIDILNCNAGTYSMATVADMTEEAWDNMFDANLKSVFLTVKEALPYLQKNKSGSIILTSAVFGVFMQMKKMAHYNASKAAVVAFAKTLALEVAEQNIRVNCICPGQISHQLHTKENHSITTDPNLIRTGLPEDIAQAALYFASTDAAWITGAVLAVDGGMSIGVQGKK